MNEPKERPILMSGPMVRAILEGRKTVTRRVMKPQPTERPMRHRFAIDMPYQWDIGDNRSIYCPYGQPGDRLWVRETWHTWGPPERQFLAYRATQPDADDFVWRPSIHMPRWASRLTLEIVGVRVERVQDITEEGAIAEGVERDYGVWRDYQLKTLNGVPTARDSFRSLWDSINGAAYSWDANPWCWVVSFRRV
jgi:hypothetical protein